MKLNIQTDFTKFPRAVSVLHAAEAGATQPAGTATLAHDERHLRRHDTRIVDEHVQFQRRQQGRRFLKVCDVLDDRPDTRSGRQFRKGAFAAGKRQNLITSRSQGDACRTADAAAGAGNESKSKPGGHLRAFPTSMVQAPAPLRQGERRLTVT